MKQIRPFFEHRRYVDTHGRTPPLDRMAAPARRLRPVDPPAGFGSVGEEGLGRGRLHPPRTPGLAAGIMREWDKYSIVRQARGNGLLLGVSFGKPESASIDEKDWWTARAVRGKMLENGVWAISDREDTIRMYPALNMEESVLREGLQVMEDAIRHVDEHGHTEGDATAYPSGVAGF